MQSPSVYRYYMTHLFYSQRLKPNNMYTDEKTKDKSRAFLYIKKKKLWLFYYSCPIIPPIAVHFPTQPWLSQAIPTLLFTSMSHLYMFLDQTLPRCTPSYPPCSISSGHCQSVFCFHASVSTLLICLFCSLGSTYRKNHMVFVFHCLAYFTQHKTLQFRRTKMAAQVDTLRLLAQPEMTENRTARGTNTKETENNHSSRLVGGAETALGWRGLTWLWRD